MLDVCPQENISELLLGGMTNQRSASPLSRQGELPRATIGGYFQDRFLSPYSAPTISHGDFITKPSRFNGLIPDNVDLICGGLTGPPSRGESRRRSARRSPTAA